MKRGEEARFSLANRVDHVLVLDRIVEHDNGGFTWVGHIQDAGTDFRAIVTTGADGATGEIRTPHEKYLLRGSQGLVVASEAGLSPMPTCSPTLRVHAPGTFPVVESTNQFAAETAIDLLVLYTPGLAASAGTSADAAINHLVTLTNQAYVDSGVNARIRVVHMQQVGYTEHNSNDTALDDLTDSVGAFVDVPALRAAKGADLVTLIRPLDSDRNDSCGVGWLNGSNGEPMDKDAAFSVVSYGSHKGIYCDSYTLAHELGHTMGSAHDLEHASSPGAFPYSYGYGRQGIFGTIMSYIDPVVGRFSSPLAQCASGMSCGTASADNVRSLNNTAPIVATFMQGAVSVQLSDFSFAQGVPTVGGTTTLLPIPTTASLGTCSSSNTAVAAIAGAVLTGVSPGTATITCSGIGKQVTIAAGTQQVFSTTSDQTINNQGSVALSVSFKPNGADIGKRANIYVAARVLWDGDYRWFVFDGTQWKAQSGNEFPVAYTRTLAATESGLQVLNYDISEFALRSLRADIYLGYQPSAPGTSTPLVYEIVRSYR